MADDPRHRLRHTQGYPAVSLAKFNMGVITQA